MATPPTGPSQPPVSPDPSASRRPTRPPLSAELRGRRINVREGSDLPPPLEPRSRTVETPVNRRVTITSRETAPPRSITIDTAINRRMIIRRSDSDSDSSSSSTAGRTPRHRSDTTVQPRYQPRASTRGAITQEDVNQIPTEVPQNGDIRAISITHNRLSTRIRGSQEATLSFESNRPLGRGGSSQVLEVTINGETKALLITRGIGGSFAAQNFDAFITPLTNLYQIFKRSLGSDIVRIDAIGSIPYQQDPFSLRLTIVMEPLSPLPDNRTIEQDIGYAEKIMQTRTKMNNSGLLHRDIKVENLLTRNGELVWIDFLDGGTTDQIVRAIPSYEELRDYLNDHFIGSELYSHPDYHEQARIYKEERLFNPGTDLNALKEDYLALERANQEVMFAITIWSLFLGKIPSPEGSKDPDLQEMNTAWNAYAAIVPENIWRFVHDQLTMPFRGQE